MAGYSDTPLWKKLGLGHGPGTTAQLLHGPDRWFVPDAPAGIELLPCGTDAAAAVVVAFYREPTQFLAALDALAERIRPSGMPGLTWSRKAAGEVSYAGECCCAATRHPPSTKT